MTPQDRTYLRFPREVQAYLGVSRRTVYRLRGDLPLRKRGKLLWVRREAVDRWVERGLRG